MRFSLIMATLGRFDEVAEFCKVLVNQTYKDFELIVVDQNEGDTLTRVLAPFLGQCALVHIKSDRKGLSFNRNIGLRRAKGDIIAFPDDDCLYNADTLEFVARRMQEEQADYFCINWRDYKNPTAFRSVLEEPRLIKKKDFFSVGSSITLFVTKSVIETFAFDEQLGVGAKYGCGEESDLLLHCLSKGARCFCDGTYYIHHPYKKAERVDVKRSYSYALGYGALMKKAFCFYHIRNALFLFLIALAKNIVGMVFSTRRKHHRTAFAGKIVGFCTYSVRKERA